MKQRNTNNKTVLKILDTFSGAGGFSLGFHLAGQKIIGAIEIDKWAAETFAENHREAKMMIGDIRHFEVMKTGKVIL
jgi:DNA (cytosine-5)-methyltransferase 1